MAHGCALRKFPACSRTLRKAQGVSPGACFFGSFLCTSKERDAPAASGTMCPRRRSVPQGQGAKTHNACGKHHGERRHGLRWPSPQPLSHRERGSKTRRISEMPSPMRYRPWTERRHGPRWTSPQPLSPTGTSFGRRRERGLMRPARIRMNSYPSSLLFPISPGAR